MHIQHIEKGFRLSDRELLQIARRVGKLATYCKRVKNEGSGIRIDSEYRSTEKRQDQMKVMITVELPGTILRAESRRPDIAEAVDRCIEKLEPQVKRYKETNTGRGKMRRGKRR